MFDLGNFYKKERDFEKADYYFSEAFKNQPFDLNRNMQIAEFMYFAVDRCDYANGIVDHILDYDNAERAELLKASYTLLNGETNVTLEILARPSNDYRVYADLLYQNIYEMEFNNIFLKSNTITKDTISQHLKELNSRFDNLILFKSFRSKEFKSFAISLDVHISDFENSLKANLLKSEFDAYLAQRYKRYTSFEFNRLVSDNDLDAINKEALMDLLMEYLYRYKSVSSLNDKDRISDNFISDLKRIGITKGLQKSYFNYL